MPISLSSSEIFEPAFKAKGSDMASTIPLIAATPGARTMRHFVEQTGIGLLFGIFNVSIVTP